ncbi:hypothetical protein [Aliarcobacter lanthieri]|uniref:hypothetical protein n=1 Tax=Aliarcobacter lanthieri TaxID=1355374 RepID=UPI00047DE0DC|nr:hypothetical protein [Aliarcobacter lanthieri]QKF59288.1 hypothetical protein ALANTH_1179 [Aliarcobacter lanthieri]
MVLTTIALCFILLIIIVLNGTSNEEDEVIKKYNEIKKRNNDENNTNQVSNYNILDDENSTMDMIINPTTGLSMVDGGLIDVGGNEYGTSSNE